MCLGTKWANSYYLFFLTGTSTPTNIYRDGALTTAFTPTGRVTADNFGRFPPIYLDPSITYRLQFFNSANMQQWQNDPYISQLATVGTSALSAFGFQIATTGEVTLDAPNTGGSGVTLTLNSGALGTAALELIGTLPGNSALIVNNSATTGAQTATFTAANKPGTATSAPAGWLPITCDGVQYYTPIWHGNPFTPYVANPGAVGEMISALSVTFGGNGLTTPTSGTAVPGNWFSPTSAGIGASYWINITRTGGSPGVNFSAAQGSWVNIGAGGLTISGSAPGTVTGTYQLSSSSSGTPVVASGTITITFSPVTHTYSTAVTNATETIPNGATNCVAEECGGGGGGGGGNNPNGSGSGGGSSGSVRSSFPVTGGNTLIYTVGAAGGAGADASNGAAGGASSISSGTQVIATMTANGGGFGKFFQIGPGAPGGAGGTASGGNAANTSGNAGMIGLSGGSATGGVGGAAVNALGGTGGKGGNANLTLNSVAGDVGTVKFSYT